MTSIPGWWPRRYLVVLPLRAGFSSQNLAALDSHDDLDRSLGGERVTAGELSPRLRVGPERGESAGRSARRRFSWSKVAERYESLFRGLIGE